MAKGIWTSLLVGGIPMLAEGGQQGTRGKLNTPDAYEPGAPGSATFRYMISKRSVDLRRYGLDEADVIRGPAPIKFRLREESV